MCRIHPRKSEVGLQRGTAKCSLLQRPLPKPCMLLSTHTAQIIDIAIATATASWLSPGEAPSRVHCSTKNLTKRFVQLAVRNSWLSSPLASLAWVMGHRSLHLATAPQRFAADWLGSCAFLAEECGFARVDNVRERGTVTPGRHRCCSVRGRQPAMTGSALTLLHRGLCG